MKSRNWSIRSKIIAMVAVPLTAVLALWVFATVVTAGPAINLIEARDSVAKLGEPGLRLISQLQRERHFSAIYQGTTRPAKTELARERSTTDQIIAEFQRSAGDAEPNEEVAARVKDLLVEIDKLPVARQEVDERTRSYFYTVQNYDRIIDAAFDVSRTAAVFFNERVDRESRGLISAFRGLEHLSRIDALLAGANAQGRIDAAVREQIILSIGTADYLISSGVADLPEEAQGDYSKLITDSSFVELDILKKKMLAQGYVGGPPPVAGVEWQATYDYVAQELRSFGMRVVDEISEDATPLAIDIIARLVAAALLGMVALGLSVYVSVRLGRSLVGRLIRLRREALELASERLPSVVRRLRHGESVDVDMETPPLEYGQDEIGQLGRAFRDVQRTAVLSAIEEANVRRGINDVFLNIARRSQTLLHRQLSLLDKMERRETDPQELEDLYRVDHLATRMRRHAEDLVILAGAAPGRGWRNPVPVIDVVRGAISEVEDYKRVDIRTVSTAALVGRTVGDVIHLLAELIENAASYSPPHTRVQVSGQLLPNGYAVEIEDRGLGMADDAMELANRRLVEPPDFDPADSARLGLFVVAQLAHRHGIKVSLRTSPYGGITAIVLVPGELVAIVPGTSSGGTGPLAGLGDGDSTVALAWPGGGEPRPISANGSRTALEEAPAMFNGATVGVPVISGPQRTATELTGPAPSSVASELSAEGLVQRKRTRKGEEPPPVEIEAETVTGPRSGTLLPADSGPSPDQTFDLSMLDEIAAGLPSAAPRSIPRNSTPAAPVSPAPWPLDTGIPAAPVADSLGDDGLPRRVRQANLAPQLRQVVVDPEPTGPARSPEQARSLMSALQSGTRRGRVDAARKGSPASRPAVPEHAVEPVGGTFDDAATVSFPALVDSARADSTKTGEKAPSGPEAGVAGDHVDGPGENLLLEKDA
ncbi:sensor histidine kinase [Actinoplanes derwentensis]|uniref:histidine kinase n=1 Tax=Actinoplanes derwentensis TaxID=113562 RepID=A0A1H2CEE9_9ACTN|nr:nitrate- and nitrite sensing domain-containing protein [Actinoplanes derwentensis]GID86038.1 histidine kinase [Actinoplanes derwentensis]SDT68821.1 Signal transduction histidine kinase [Actinoplanes derwentensis]